jgi:hypothetical protein
MSLLRYFTRRPGRTQGSAGEFKKAPEAGPYRAAVWVLLGLVLVRGLLYALLTPPWQAPDEPGHFEYAWAIARRGGPAEPLNPGAVLAWLRGIPRPNAHPAVQAARPQFERGLLDSLYETQFFEYRHRPPPEPRLQSLDQISLGRTLPSERFSTAYVWQALFIGPALQGSVLDQLYLARLSSVVVNLAIVGLGIAAARTLLPDRPGLALGVGIALVFWPQHTFINSTVNEGPLAELGATLAVYGWARLFARTFSVIGIAAVVGGTLLGLSAKANAVFLLALHPLLLVVYLAATLRFRRPRALLLALLAAALLAGGLWVVYRTDLVSLDRTRQALGILRQRLTPDPELAERLGDRPWWWVFDSYWGFFGWMHVRAPDDWYRAMYVLAALGVMGWLIPRRDFPWPGPGPTALAWLAPALAVAMLAVYIGFVDPTYLQGRYLFTAAVPAAMLLVVGWARLVPARLEKHFLPGLGLVLAALDLVAFWSWVTFFYP